MDKPWGFRQEFGRLKFWEPLCGWEIGGTVCEVGVDGSFLIRPNLVPQEWVWEDAGDPRLGRIAPTFFLLDADLRSSTHRNMHKVAGYQFDPAALGETPFERILNLHVQNPSINAGRWYAKKIRQSGLRLPKGYEGFRVLKTGKDSLYFTVADKPVYGAAVSRFCRMDADGGITEILSVPGRFLACSVHPLDNQKLLVSAEGFPEEDPRFQSLWEIDLRTKAWRVVEFPTPLGHQLYGSRLKFFEEHAVMLLNRYGFVPEGGGLWMGNFGHPDYEPKRRLLGWDHSQTWMHFETPDPQVFNLFFTAKEVDNGMTMTVNQAVLHLDGNKTYVTDPQRIAKVRGWNPIPFHVERDGPYRHLIYVATNSYKAYTESRAAGVYVLEFGMES